jgi:hypothetical protein
MKCEVTCRITSQCLKTLHRVDGQNEQQGPVLRFPYELHLLEG